MFTPCRKLHHKGLAVYVNRHKLVVTKIIALDRLNSGYGLLHHNFVSEVNSVKVEYRSGNAGRTGQS